MKIKSFSVKLLNTESNALMTVEVNNACIIKVLYDTGAVYSVWTYDLNAFESTFRGYIDDKVELYAVLGGFGTGRKICRVKVLMELVIRQNDQEIIIKNVPIIIDPESTIKGIQLVLSSNLFERAVTIMNTNCREQRTLTVIYAIDRVMYNEIYRTGLETSLEELNEAWNKMKLEPALKYKLNAMILNQSKRFIKSSIIAEPYGNSGTSGNSSNLTLFTDSIMKIAERLIENDDTQDTNLPLDIDDELDSFISEDDEDAQCEFISEDDEDVQHEPAWPEAEDNIEDLLADIRTASDNISSIFDKN